MLEMILILVWIFLNERRVERRASETYIGLLFTVFMFHVVLNVQKILKRVVVTRKWFDYCFLNSSKVFWPTFDRLL